jgi:hypothetical protein
MFTIKRIALFVFVIFAAASMQAQELRCNVQVNAQKIAGLDQRVFQRMQQQMNEFMNNRAWTQDAFGPDERIECALLIFLESNPAQDVFKATITVQSSRPVHNSSYNTPLINFRDMDFRFTYTENMPIDFNVLQYNTNLASVLAYYAYFFIAMDYESMSKGGGAKYFTFMENILNQIPANNPESEGWNAFDRNPVSGNRNRYNIITSLQNPRFSVFKEAMTMYHLNGLDLFYEKPKEARAGITAAMEKLLGVFSDNPNNALITIFMQTKGEELINIYSQAEQAEKIKIIPILKKLDPANAARYDKIIKG